jgi:hypothetical protein
MERASEPPQPMTATIIFALLCLATASLALRTILLIAGGLEHGHLAKRVPAAAWAEFLPQLAIEWACNLAMASVLVLVLAYRIAPQSVGDMLGELLTRPPVSIIPLADNEQ